MAVITLLTDFGLKDEYVGVMKGVLLTRFPGAVIVDISHGIAPQDVCSASLMLRSAFGSFPAGAVHLVVVDPGVGTERDLLAAETDGHSFVAPDNGVLTAVFADFPPARIVRIERPDLFQPSAGRTFHGRDRLAPAAAFLAAGGRIDELGPGTSLSKIRQLDLPRARLIGDAGIAGEILAVDRFGNLITNIPASLIDPLADGSLETVEVRFGHDERRICGIAATYGSVDKGALLATIGSRDTVEVAVNGGSAAALSGAGPGDPVHILPGRRT